MAYREFRNEPTYNPSQAPDMGLTAQALHDAMAERRARAAAKAAAAKQKEDAKEKFKLDLEKGKFTDTQEEILKRAKQHVSSAYSDIDATGTVTTATKQGILETQQLAQNDAINFEKMQGLIADAQKVAQDDPYTIVDVRLEKIRKAAYGDENNKIDYTKRSESLNKVQETLGDIDEFNQSKHVADWVKSQEVQERTKKTSIENGGTATTVDNSVTFKSRFFDEKGNPRVTATDASNYISADPRVGKYYDQVIEKEIQRDAEAIKAANPEYYQALVTRAGGEDKVVEHLKINHKDNIRAPKVDFGTRKNLAAQEDLNEKFKFDHITDYKKNADLTELRMRAKDREEKAKDVPTITAKEDGEFSTSFTNPSGTQSIGKVYTPVQLSVSDKNKKNIQLDTSVDFFDFGAASWNKAGSGDIEKRKKALQNINFSAADYNYVVRNSKTNSQIAATDFEDLITKIKRHPKPQDLKPDFFIKATATDASDDSADDEEGTGSKKQDRTIGIYYDDVKAQMAAKGIKVDLNGPEFQAQSKKLQRINAAIEEAKANQSKKAPTKSKIVGSKDIFGFK